MGHFSVEIPTSPGSVLSGNQQSNFTVAGTGASAPLFTSDTTKAAFAYQGILGVNFPIQSLPGLSLTADYRIMALTGTRTYNGAASATLPSGVRATGTGTMEWGHEYNNTFMFGIRYNFGVVPPPPPAAPAPVPAAAPSRSYLVFFDWDKVQPHRSCAPDHRGSGGQLRQGAVHADRGERLYRYLWHTAVQPGPVGSSSESSGGATDCGRRAGECDHHSGLRRHAPAWCRLVQACASRRIVGWRSSSVDFLGLSRLRSRSEECITGAA